MIERQDIVDIPWKLRYSFVLQIALGLHYLHYHDPKKSYVHLDLKLENVLLTTNLKIKLADFGSMDLVLATGVVSTTNLPKSKQLTVYYSAPERLRDPKMKATGAMDVYRQEQTFVLFCIFTAKPTML